TDYLKWLVREKPSRLQVGQLNEAEQILMKRREEREAERQKEISEAERERRDAANAADQSRRHRDEVRAKGVRKAARSDPVLARHLEEEAERKRQPPKIPDPDYFGGAGG